MEDTDQINQSVPPIPGTDHPQQVSTSESVQEKLPQQPQHQVTYAGFWVRYVASVIDGFVFLIPFIILSAILGFLLPKTGLLNNIGGLLILVAFWAVDIYFVTKYGATPGKMFFGLKIVSADGEYPRFKRAILRDVIGKIVSGLLLNLGYLWIVFDKQKQGFHDKIAGTYVLATKPLTGGRKILVFILAGLFPLAIIGILAAAILVVVNPAGRQQQANDARIKNDIGQISSALSAYNSSKNTYPSQENGLVELTKTGDLPSVPLPPIGGSGSFYVYQTSPVGCAGTTQNPCTSFTVSYMLFGSKVPGNVWCSKVGAVQEVASSQCTP